jgi:hypothetical protein
MLAGEARARNVMRLESSNSIWSSIQISILATACVLDLSNDVVPPRLIQLQIVERGITISLTTHNCGVVGGVRGNRFYALAGEARRRGAPIGSNLLRLIHCTNSMQYEAARF